MAMGRRKKREQRKLWIEERALAKAPGHPFYEKLSAVLDESGFDTFVEKECRPFYAKTMGRPSLAPAIYFRLLLIGYFEGIDSERGIAWRLADSMTLREFLGYELTDPTPDHSTLSRNRRLIDLETHEAVFGHVLTILAKDGLLKGKTLGVDATTLEANAALRSIVLRDNGEGYNEFLVQLAQASGIETPIREDLARIDRKRKNKGSNDDWMNPNDPDAKITKMKDGRTRLAHKAEHAVDLDTGAIVAITVQPANRGDTASLNHTLDEVAMAFEDILSDPGATAKLADKILTELVADKGYHSNDVLKDQRHAGMRTYISEPKRGRRNWNGKPEEKEAVYANRRRIRGRRGKQLLRKRGEFVERPFAHCFETGGMRRTHLRGHRNISKRLLIHVAGCNLGLLMRKRFGFGTSRSLQGIARRLLSLQQAFLGRLRELLNQFRPDFHVSDPIFA